MKKVLAATAGLVLIFSACVAWRFLSIPKYGWLVFGPEAKVRLLLRADGDSVRIDVNGNGRFDAGEKVSGMSSSALSIPFSDGKTSYVITGISSYEHDRRHNITITVDVKGRPGFRQLGDLWLSRTRIGASIAHFNGPLEIQAQTMLWELPKDLALRRGDTGTDIRVNIGTIRKADRCWTTVYTQHGTNAFFPANVFPWVNVEFPSKTGGAPIAAKYALDKVC